MKIRGLNKAIKNTINNWLGPILFVLLIAALYRQLSLQKDLQGSLRHVMGAYRNPLFWLAFFLWLVNWGIESLKWQRILAHLEVVSFYSAFRAVLAGTAVTMLTPNRTGEFAGRILFVSQQNRVTAISLTFLGSIAQLLVTLLMGLAGLLLLRLDIFRGLLPGSWAYDLPGDFLLITTLLLTIALGMFFFQVARFVELLRRFGVFNKLMKHLDLLQDFSRKQLLRIVILSFFRYLIFILQYVLLLKVFVPEINPQESLVLLMVFYLVMTAMPSIGLTELPLRAAASVQIFGLITSNVLGLQMAAFSIWCINLMLPAAIGSLFLARVRLFGKK